MPKISALPPMTTAADDDEAPIVDKSVTTTKKWTLTLLKSYLQSLLAWISHSMVADGFLVQSVSTIVTGLSTGTTIIPGDDTIPQNTEGNEYMTLSITPKSATNILIIDVSAFISNSATNSNDTIALFKDSVAGALAADTSFQAVGTAPSTIPLQYAMVAGTTSPITFKVRGGSNVAGTTSFNGVSGSRRFGGVCNSSIVIKEIKAS